MHVEQPPRPGAFVQVVDVLRDEKQLARPVRIEPRQSEVRGVGHHLAQPCPARVVKLVHERGVAGIGFGCRDILDPVAFPQAIGGTKGGEPALGGDAGTGEDDNVADMTRLHRVHIARLKNAREGSLVLVLLSGRCRAEAANGPRLRHERLCHSGL